jgi:hypothetical protein
MEASILETGQLEKFDESTSASSDRLKNLYSVLEVYEPSESFLNSPDVVVPRAPAVEYVVEDEKSPEEAVFALIALLSDYERLGHEVSSLWAAYQAKELDLAAVSVATNAAFELARVMEDDIKPIIENNLILPGNPDYLVFHDAHFHVVCESYEIDFKKKQQPSDQYNYEAYSIAKFYLINTLLVLNGYRKDHSADDIMNNQLPLIIWYDEALGQSGKDNREKFHQDFTALLELLPDLQFLASALGKQLVEDEMIRGMDDMMKAENRGCPLWFAWAAQNYVNILQSLGKDCDKGYREMQNESLRIKKAMLNVPDGNPQRQEVLCAASMWDRDLIWRFRHHLISEGILPPLLREYEEFRFLRRHPMYCGLLINYMRTIFHDQGVIYLTEPRAVTRTTQLYQAIRQENLLRPGLAWKDLETFWEMQGNKAFFIGDPPTDREGYYKNYCMCTGASVRNWAPTKRKGRPILHKANRRKTKINGWVSAGMNSRLLTPRAEAPSLSWAFIEELLDFAHRHRHPDYKGIVSSDKDGEDQETQVRIIPTDAHTARFCETNVTRYTPYSKAISSRPGLASSTGRPSVSRRKYPTSVSTCLPCITCAPTCWVRLGMSSPGSSALRISRRRWRLL